MRSLTVSKGDFDDIVYPLVATIPARSAGELHMIIKILNLFEKRSTPDTDAIVDAALGTPTLYKLSDDRAVFRLEDAQATLVRSRLEDGIKTLSPMRARVIPELMEQLASEAPVVDDVTPPAEDA